ncbi:MAG: stage II sporulation protein P [Clostridia bacterium]|nr:stage II sporulation protein P [Clostridia bacterium]
MIRCGAAVLLAMALLGGSFAYEREQARVPLVIEVVASAGHAPEAEQNTGPQSEQQSGRPRVLLYHTHTWEAYEMTAQTQYTPTETWRTKDERYNMVRIGQELKNELEQLGFEVIHDQTAFEPPTLSSAYTRSLEMLEQRLEAGERYDYILDIHRDAYSGDYNGANSAQSAGKSLAYIMLLVGKGTGTTNSGFDERPDWPKNLDLAQRITDSMNAQVKGVSREVKVKTGRFNQHVSTGALLIEVGNNRNTLDEALAACPVIAHALLDVYTRGKNSD